MESEASSGVEELYVFPAIFEFNIFQKQAFAESIAALRQQHPSLVVHYDDAELTHPLVVHAFAERIIARLAGTNVSPNRVALLLVASGHGDDVSRATSYALMRLLWERLSLARGEVAFLRHPTPFLAIQLERCRREPYLWVIVPQLWGNDEHADYLNTILDDAAKSNPETDEWLHVEPFDDDPHLSAWMQQRIVRLWNEKRSKLEAKQPSAKREPRLTESLIHAPSASFPISSLPAGDVLPDLTYGGGLIAEIREPDALAALLQRIGLTDDRVFVKVTWHGYAPGTFTDAAALDTLLTALRGKAVIVEGHTSSRNVGDADWDWETESRDHRAWIWQQDAEYRRRTGIDEVMRRHDAQYVNVTEAFWDGQCVPQDDVIAFLNESGITLTEPRLASFVPTVFWEHRGAPFLSFARFKGATRLGISNLFGLIPDPLRTEWHGPNITYFAQICCDMAKIVGAIFRPYGLVESLNVAVRWNRQGLYRTRWGNYDLIPNPNLVALSRGFATADVLASRLQGQDIRRSAFFDVVANSLGFPDETATLPISDELIQRFV